MLVSLALSLGSNCSSRPHPPKVNLQTSVNERFHTYEENRIVVNPSLFASSFYVGEEGYSLNSLAGVFDYGTYVSPQARADYHTSRYLLYSGLVVGGAGVSILVYNNVLLKEPERALQATGAGVSLLGTIIEAIGFSYLYNAVKVYNKDLQLYTVPEFAAEPKKANAGRRTDLVYTYRFGGD